MSDEPIALASKLWSLAFAIGGAAFALWFAAQVLLQIWWVIAIVAVLAVIIVGVVRWRRYRSW